MRVRSRPGLFTHVIAVNRTAKRRTRRTRLLTWGIAVVLGTTASAVMDSSFAEVAPGPAPELSALIAAANAPGDLDPTFGQAGEWHATTINATPLSWFELAVCKVRGNCVVFPLATGSSTAQQAAESMARSLQDAADMAATWTGGTGDFDTVMTADMGPVGGGSAGLMLTLAFIDAATEGDLTGGRVIAGTGTMNTLSEVGPVTGVEYKILGAQAAGAEVFFAPHLREEEAREAAQGTGIEVIPVAYLPDALRWLCDNGGVSSVCASPALTADAPPGQP